MRKERGKKFKEKGEKEGEREESGKNSGKRKERREAEINYDAGVSQSRRSEPNPLLDVRFNV